MIKMNGPVRIGIGGPVGAGKTSLTAVLARSLSQRFSIGVITNDIYKCIEDNPIYSCLEINSILPMIIKEKDYLTKKEKNISKKKIFLRSWHWIGDDTLLKEKNTIIPYNILPEFLDEPVLVSCSEEDKLTCFSNVCTHRANILIDKPCESKEITCKYHGRRFSCNGEFIFMPEFKEVKNFSLKQDNLSEIPLNRWKQFLFCSLNPKINFNSLIQDMEKRIGWMPIEKFQFDFLTFSLSHEYKLLFFFVKLLKASIYNLILQF